MTENTEIMDVAPEAAPNESTAIMLVIERAAMNPDVDIDKMERLLQMQERILDRNAEMAFNSALAEMQPNIPSIPRNGRGHNNIKYAYLEDIQKVITPVLSSYGFGLTFDTDTTKDVVVTAILVHRDGHSKKATITLPSDGSGSKNAVQAKGSSITYGQRYALKALLNLSLGDEDDDDGAGAGAAITADQFVVLQGLLEKTNSNEDAFLKYYGAGTLDQFPPAKFKAAVSQLEKKAAK